MMRVQEQEELELMGKEENIEQASRAMKAMSHPLRLKILCVLGDKEVSVQDIVDNVEGSERSGHRRQRRHFPEQHLPASGHPAR